MTTASQINGGNTAYERVASDYYPTPPDATMALIDYLQIPKNLKIWEPACGEGHMSDVFAREGYAVISSDIRDTGYGTPNVDFLSCDIPQCDWIVTNPPFRLASDFIRRCHKIDKPFALLVKSQFWHARSRYELFNANPPSFILPLTWRPDFLCKTRGGGSPLMDVIWSVWDRQTAPTQYHPLERPRINLER